MNMIAVASGHTVGFPVPLDVSIIEQRLTLYIFQTICWIPEVESVIEGCSMRKNKKLMSMARVWFHNAVSLWFSVRLTIVFHSRLGAHGTGNIKLLKLFLKLYLDKIWQISHTNPKVTVVLLFRYKIDFLVNSCLDTDPAGRDFMKEHTFSGLFVFLWKSVWSDHVLHHIRTCLDRWPL